MEILFMVFMSVVSIMALFAVMVVFRDIIQETLSAKKEREKTDRTILEHAERIIAEAEARKLAAKDEAVVLAPIAVAAAPVPVPEPAPVVEEPVAVEVAEEIAEEVVAEEPVVEEPAAEEVVAEPVAEEAAEEVVEATDDADKISFSKGQQQTLEEKYLALPAEQRRWYDEIIKYASAVEGSKRFKNARYEEYKVGKNRLVRLLIKRGIIHCEFILHNSDFKNYINENKISVKQSATTMLVESAATIAAVKNSIDIVVAAIAEEKKYKQKLAREKRRAARAGQSAETAEVAKAESEN